jgi:hypothetical protein
MTYDTMEIGDGGAASDAYLEILKPETTEKRRQEMRRDLKIYCGQDTGGMVEILRCLYEAIS